MGNTELGGDLGRGPDKSKDTLQAQHWGPPRFHRHGCHTLMSYHATHSSLQWSEVAKAPLPTPLLPGQLLPWGALRGKPWLPLAPCAPKALRPLGLLQYQSSTRKSARLCLAEVGSLQSSTDPAFLCLIEIGFHCAVQLTLNSLCRPGQPQTCRDAPISGSPVLGLQV